MEPHPPQGDASDAGLPLSIPRGFPELELKDTPSTPAQKESTIHAFLVKLILMPVHCYRYCVSPLMPAHCRFTPTCSGYALEAVRTHGISRGLLLTARRLLRCHPFCKGGYDPVPPKSTYL